MRKSNLRVLRIPNIFEEAERDGGNEGEKERVLGGKEMPMCGVNRKGE